MATQATFPSVDSFLDPYVLRQVDLRAAWLVKHSSLPATDVDDVKQDMLVRLAVAFRDRFDPVKSSPHSFADRVMNGLCKDFIRRVQSKRRRGRRECAFTDLGSHCDPDRTAVGTGVLDDLVRREQCQAVRAVVRDLPDDLRQLSEAMARIPDRRALAKHLGVGRSTLYRRIDQLAHHLVSAGLAESDSLENCGTHSANLRK